MPSPKSCRKRESFHQMCCRMKQVGTNWGVSWCWKNMMYLTYRPNANFITVIVRQPQISAIHIGIKGVDRDLHAREHKCNVEFLITRQGPYPTWRWLWGQIDLIMPAKATLTNASDILEFGTRNTRVDGVRNGSKTKNINIVKFKENDTTYFGTWGNEKPAESNI